MLRIRFAQASEPCKKRGKVGSVKQRLLAELNAFEVTSFDRCVERSATDTEQVKCLPDPVSCLRKTENTGVNRIVTRVLVGTSSWHGSIRRIVYAWFARVRHGRIVPYAPDRMNNLNLRSTTLCLPSGIGTLGCSRKWCGFPVGLDLCQIPNDAPGRQKEATEELSMLLHFIDGRVGQRHDLA